MFESLLQKFLEKDPATSAGGQGVSAGGQPLQKLIVIYGPTGSGKTEMSIEIAKYLNTEIISTDSRQLFRGMDIGTGKIKPEEMQGIVHHMIDILNPDEAFSMGDFVAQSEEILKEIWGKGKIPILAGGTGLYIDSLIFERNAPKIPAHPEIRKSFASLSNTELYKKLQEIDPNYAKELHENNRPYIERALEIKLVTGKSKSEFRFERILKYEVLFLNAGYRFLENFDGVQQKNVPLSKGSCLVGGGGEKKIGKTYSQEIIFSPEYRAWLYERINARVEMMFQDGLLPEVENLLKKGYHFGDFGMKSIGYYEFEKYFSGEKTLSEIKETIQQHSRNYAKRQLTWFKRYTPYMVKK